MVAVWLQSSLGEMACSVLQQAWPSEGTQHVIPRIGVKAGTSQPPVPALRMSWSFLPGDKLNRSSVSKGHCVSPPAWWLLIQSGSWGGSKRDGLWEALCSLWLLWCCSRGSPRAPHPVHLVQARTTSCLIKRASGSMETVQALAMALPCSAASAPTPGLPWSSCQSSSARCTGKESKQKNHLVG